MRHELRRRGTLRNPACAHKKKFGINGRILSIEGIQKWAQNTKKYLSDEQLKFTEILVEKPEVIKKRLSIVEKKKNRNSWD